MTLGLDSLWVFLIGVLLVLLVIGRVSAQHFVVLVIVLVLLLLLL